MKEKAASVGERVRSVRDIIPSHSSVIDRLFWIETQEDGVRTASTQIYAYHLSTGRDRRSPQSNVHQ
jgi:hypothetical protein